MRGKVILFYPAYDGPPLSAPLCLLSLAATLRAANFTVVLIDAAIEANYRSRILREASNALCLGISVLTGPMIHGAIEVATAVKQRYPNLPVIFGGWHPSLLPEQTLNEPYVDAVVRGPGRTHPAGNCRSACRRRPARTDSRPVVETQWRRSSQSRPPRAAAGLASHARLRPGRLRRLRARLRHSQTRLRHQRWLSLRLQLLHRHGFLQAALQRAVGRARRRRTRRPRDALSHRRK